MDMKVDFIWLPIDRVAMLLNKNLKTIRRMVDAGKLTALKHQIPTKNGATIKTFVLATEEIIQAEYDRFRDSLRKPELYAGEARRSRCQSIVQQSTHVGSTTQG